MESKLNVVLFLIGVTTNLSLAGNVLVSEDTLANLVAKVENLVAKVDDLEKSNEELRDRVASFEADKKNCKTQAYDLGALRDGVDSRTKRFLLSDDSGLTAFSAAIQTRAVGGHSNGQTIVFDTVITNIGNAYSPHDGVFVAPLKGLYMFSCSVLDDEFAENMLHAEFAVNGVAKARIFAFADHNAHRDQGAQTIFVQLNQGDHVLVRHIDEDNGTVGGELYTTFSGLLLSAME